MRWQELVAWFVAAASPLLASVTTCGDPGALSVMVSVPRLNPTEVGFALTWIVQVEPADTDAPQVVVCEKSPDAEILLIASGAAPVLLSVKG